MWNADISFDFLRKSMPVISFDNGFACMERKAGRKKKRRRSPLRIHRNTALCWVKGFKLN